MKKSLSAVALCMLVMLSACGEGANIVEMVPASSTDSKAVVEEREAASQIDVEEPEEESSQEEVLPNETSDEWSDEFAQQMVETWFKENYPTPVTVEPLWLDGGIRLGNDDNAFSYEILDDDYPLMVVYVYEATRYIFVADREGHVPIEDWFEWNGYSQEGRYESNNDPDEVGYDLNIDKNFEWVDIPEVIDGSILFGPTIEGSVRNKTNQQFTFVMIQFMLYDSSGAQIGTAGDTIASIGAGNTWKFSAPVNEPGFEYFEFSGITVF